MIRPSSRWGVPIALLAVFLPRPVQAQIDDSRAYTFTAFERLEYGVVDGSERVLWDARLWVGDDYDKLWIEAEGEALTGAREFEGEVQAVWSHLISPFWDLQIGARLDVDGADTNTRTRAHFVVGLEGLAPYWFELTPALFVSHRGDVSLRFSGSYDAFVTQRLIIQGRGEADVAVQSVPEFGVGSGFSSTELGFRLRYEVERKFAPFVGWRWERRYGDTADLARGDGEQVAEGYLVLGVRAWF